MAIWTALLVITFVVHVLSYPVLYVTSNGVDSKICSQEQPCGSLWTAINIRQSVEQYNSSEQAEIIVYGQNENVTYSYYDYYKNEDEAIHMNLNITFHTSEPHRLGYIIAYNQFEQLLLVINNLVHDGKDEDDWYIGFETQQTHLILNNCTISNIPPDNNPYNRDRETGSISLITAFSTELHVPYLYTLSSQNQNRRMIK